MVVAVDHLLNVLVVSADVADIPSVSGPVADAGNCPGDWEESLSPVPGS